MAVRSWLSCFLASAKAARSLDNSVSKIERRLLTPEDFGTGGGAVSEAVRTGAGLGVALWLDFAAVFLLFAGAVCDVGALSVGASLTGASYRLLLYLPTIGKSLTAWQLRLDARYRQSSR